MRKKSTKLLALLTAGITAASLLAGCGSGGSDNARTTDQAQESETKTERHKDGDRETEMEREREGKWRGGVGKEGEMMERECTFCVAEMAQ